MREYEICVTSSMANLAKVADFASERARLAGMGEDQVFEVQMAVDEACANAMEHAYKGRQDGEIRVCCYVEKDDFVVCVTDYGKPFDPSSISAPDLSASLEERDVGGLGLFFMRALMDGVEFRSGPIRGNEVIMRKHRRPSRS